MTQSTKRLEWQKRQPTLEEGPVFDDRVFLGLPDLLKDLLKISPADKLNDVILLASLVTTSALLPKITGKFGGKLYRANLYAMILAPPASNKSVINDVVTIAESVDEDIISGTFDQDLDKTDTRGLFLAGNTSKAGLTQELVRMPGCNLLYDSEIDSTAEVMSQEWGGHSDVLRKAAEHETILEKRKDKDVVRIKDPAISALLVGTPSQLNGMVSDVSSGLASRFVYFSYRCEEYIREADRLKIDTAGILEIARERVSEFFKFHLAHPASFVLADVMIAAIDDEFEKLTEKYAVDDGMRAAVLRMKTILFRLCMVLGAIEKWSANDTTSEFTSTQQAFDVALSMVQTLLSHTEMIMQFIEHGTTIKLPTNESDVLDSLQQCFKAKELYDAFEKITGRKSERTARSWCKRWEKQGLVEKKEHAEYCKT